MAGREGRAEAEEVAPLQGEGKTGTAARRGGARWAARSWDSAASASQAAFERGGGAVVGEEDAQRAVGGLGGREVGGGEKGVEAGALLAGEAEAPRETTRGRAEEHGEAQKGIGGGAVGDEVGKAVGGAGLGEGAARRPVARISRGRRSGRGL
jgi:hypothetical protein